MSDIILNKSIIEDLKLTQQAIGVYSFIQMIRNRYLDKDTMYISINMIIHEVFGTNTTNTIYSNVKLGFEELVNNNVIEVVCKLGNNEYCINTKNLMINMKTKDKVGDYYVRLREEELKAIMNYNTKSDRFSILRYFIIILGNVNYSKTSFGNINYTGKFCGYTLKYLGEKCGITNYKSICKKNGYNDILCELKLLYIYKSNSVKKKDDKSYSAFTNIYCRYEDRSLAIEYGNSREDSLGSNKSINGKTKRENNMSLNKKYTYLVSDKYKDGHYSQDVIKEILTWAKEYNNKKEVYESNEWDWSEKDINKIKSRLK